MSKIKTAIVGAAAAVLLQGTASCGGGKANNTDESDNQAKIEAAAQKQREEDNAYRDFMCDSLLNQWGYDSRARHEAEVTVYRLDEQIRQLREGNFRYAELQHKVESELDQVGGKYAEKIEKLLGKYQIGVDSTGKEQLQKMCGYEGYASWRADRYWYQCNGNDIQKSDNAPYENYSLSSFMQAINISEQGYGEVRQNEIKAEIVKLGKILRSEQETKRLMIAKSYAEYYPILDTDKMPAEFAKYFKDVECDPFYGETEGDPTVGYCRWGLSRYCSVDRSVSVYDSKLAVDFFGNEGSTYSLKRVGEGKWQVERKDAQGHVSKTKVFDDNVEYHINAGSCSEKPHSTFSYSPGANLGVHVSATEVLYVKEGTKGDQIHSDDELQKMIDPLEEEKAKTQKVVDTYKEMYSKAIDKADSLLKQKQNARQSSQQNTVEFSKER